MEFWQGFWGAFLGAAITSVVALFTHFALSARAARERRENALGEFLTVADQVAAASISRGQSGGATGLDVGAFFRAHDKLWALSRTTQRGSNEMRKFADERLMILLAYSNIGAIS